MASAWVSIIYRTTGRQFHPLFNAETRLCASFGVNLVIHALSSLFSSIRADNNIVLACRW